MWLQVELPQPLTVTELQFESAPAVVQAEPAAPGAPTRTGIPGQGRGAPGAVPAPPAPVGYPRAFEVQVSMDGTSWGPAIAKGEGTGTSTSVTFAPVRAKFVKITQTGSAPDAPPWSVLRLRLFEAPGSGPSQ
jgi:F5/8 type C domain